MILLGLWCENADKNGKFYAIRVNNRWLRGAKLWRWTRYKNCAAQIEDCGIWDEFIIPTLRQQKLSGALIEITREDGMEWHKIVKMF